MASVLEKLRKRRKYKLDLQDGDTVYLRAMTFGEARRVSEIGGEEASGGLIIGLCLLNDDGSQVFTQRSAAEGAESDSEFGSRVLIESDMSSDTAVEIIAMATKLLHSPSVENLAKNS